MTWLQRIQIRVRVEAANSQWRSLSASPFVRLLARGGRPQRSLMRRRVGLHRIVAETFVERCGSRRVGTKPQPTVAGLGAELEFGDECSAKSGAAQFRAHVHMTQ